MARVQRKEVKREAISIRPTTEAKNEVLLEMKCHNFTSYSAYFEHLREVHNASPIDAAEYEKKCDEYLKTIGYFDDGHAAEAAVDVILKKAGLL
jgi:hypothetical protein